MALTTRGKKRAPSPAPKGKGRKAKEVAQALTASEAKMLKELEAKKRAVEAAKGEVERQATRKRTASLLEREEIEREGGDTEPEDEGPPPSTQPRRKRLRREGAMSLFDESTPPPSPQPRMTRLHRDGAISSIQDLWEDDPEREVPEVEQEMAHHVENEGDIEADNGDGDGDGEETVENDNDEMVIALTPEEERKTRPASTTGRQGKNTKVTLGSFGTPRSERLAKLGHALIRRHTAVNDAFPTAMQKDQLCWKALVGAAKADSQLTQLLKELDADIVKKKKLIDYCWGGVTQIRGELVNKARIAVPHAYGVPGALKGEELQDAVRWLVDGNKLLHSGINLKERTCDEEAPWGHPIISQLIKSQWWGHRAEGSRLGSSPNNPFLNGPICQMALVATAVNCVLTSIGTGTTLEFNEPLFRSKWQFYMTMLKEFQEKSPSYLKMVQKRIQEETGIAPVTSTEFSFNFASLEAKASGNGASSSSASQIPE